MFRLLAAWFLLTIPALSATRVAVMGDSISTGAHAVDPAFNGYPARLGHLLGPEYEVRAFALGSHTLLRKADLPLTAKPVYREALAFRPDMATIMLGTNDTCLGKRDNWSHHADLESDLRAMIADLRKANPAVVIHLAGPLPMFSEREGLAPERVKDLQERGARLAEVRGIFSKVAAAEPRVFAHDLSRVIGPQETSDGVHPDTFGHAKLAWRFAEFLCSRYDEGCDMVALLHKVGVTPKRGDFGGYARYDFTLPGAGCGAVIVVPQQAAEGRPWIWRARFFGHEPELDLQLLDRGWHLVYCDVADLYGGPEAMRRWDAAYDFMAGKVGLSNKVVLEGMSRGGLPIFNWAARHPERVAAIYGDNPVCDFRTWPGGNGGKRSDADWVRLLKAWNLDETAAATAEQVVGRLEPIAAAKIPVALVLGTADEVVPPAANGEPVAKRYAELGGTVKVWRKPGAVHHPHGLHPPDALRRFLMAAAGFPANPAVVPAPSSEYRAAGQGWPKGQWRPAFAELRAAAMANPDAKVIFLGDSITQGLTGHKDRVTHTGGKRPIDLHFADRKALSLGLSGDRTEHLLWRIDHGQFDGLAPEWVVLMIGVNNINAAGHTGEETAAGTAAVLERLRKVAPGAKILLLGAFPAGKSPDDPRRAEIDALHREIRPLADGARVFYLDLRPHFLNPDGTQNDRMSGDQIHLGAAGGETWMAAVDEFIASQGG